MNILLDPNAWTRTWQSPCSLITPYLPFFYPFDSILILHFTLPTKVPRYYITLQFVVAHRDHSMVVIHLCVTLWHVISRYVILRYWSQRIVLHYIIIRSIALRPVECTTWVRMHLRDRQAGTLRQTNTQTETQTDTQTDRHTQTRQTAVDYVITKDNGVLSCDLSLPISLFFSDLWHTCDRQNHNILCVTW